MPPRDGPESPPPAPAAFRVDASSRLRDDSERNSHVGSCNRWRAMRRNHPCPYCRRAVSQPPSPAGLLPPRAADRKSVVEGKRVSVRVDLGGRRAIKKKKKSTTQENR